MIFDYIYNDYALKKNRFGYNVYELLDGKYSRIGYIPKLETMEELFGKEKRMTNLVRMREKDKIVTGKGTFVVKECWSAGGVFQLLTEENPDEILTYNINGSSLNKGEDFNIKELVEVPQPDDDKVFYIPKFDVDLLPVLRINDEDKIVIQLLDLDGLEVNKKQTLKASYKYVITALLQKKKGRDIEVIKEQKIICDSKEDCEKRLKKIDDQLAGGADFGDLKWEN